jgi:hypothetical protein
MLTLFLMIWEPREDGEVQCGFPQGGSTGILHGASEAVQSAVCSLSVSHLEGDEGTPSRTHVCRRQTQLSVGPPHKLLQSAGYRVTGPTSQCHYQVDPRPAKDTSLWDLREFTWIKDVGVASKLGSSSKAMGRVWGQALPALRRQDT